MAFAAAALPAISAAAGVVGAGISAIGAISQGQSQAAEARYQAEVARNNVVIEEQNARYAIQSGEAQTYNVGLRERAAAGAATAALAASNLDVNTGSASDVRQTVAATGQQAEETTRANAALTAYGYRAGATSYGAQARLLRAEAPMDVTSGFLRGGGLVLSNAANLGFKWNALTEPATQNVLGGTGDASAAKYGF